MLDRETFPLISRRAERKRRRPIQHVVAAIILIGTAVDQLQRGTHIALPVLEIAAGAALVALVIAERIRHHLAAGGIALVELAGAGMMLVEAFAKLEEKHHRSFYVVSFIAPVMLLAFAIFDVQISAMRRMTSDDDGFAMRVRAFWSRRVLWRDVASWTRAETSIDAKLRNGRAKQFRFNGVENRGEAMEWAAAQFARHVSAPDQVPARQHDAQEREDDQVFVPGERRAE